MSPIKQRLLAAIEQTPEPLLEQTLAFLEFLATRPPSAIAMDSRSFFEVAQAAIGAGEGPGDLSTNPDYMQGYGQ